MPAESLGHLLPPALRVALGRPPMAGGSSDVSEGTSDSKEEGAQSGYRRRRGDSQHQGEEYFQGDGSERRSLEYDSKAGDSNMTNASCGWDQPNALVMSEGCDKVLRVWEVTG